MNRLMYACAAALVAVAPAALAQSSTLARSLAATCAGCHGTQGQARGEMKTLAGLPEMRIVSALNDYKSGALPGTVMPQIAKGYTEEQIRLVAACLSAQKPRP